MPLHPAGGPRRPFRGLRAAPSEPLGEQSFGELTRRAALLRTRRRIGRVATSPPGPPTGPGPRGPSAGVPLRAGVSRSAGRAAFGRRAGRGLSNLAAPEITKPSAPACGAESANLIAAIDGKEEASAPAARAGSATRDPAQPGGFGHSFHRRAQSFQLRRAAPPRGLLRAVQQPPPGKPGCSLTTPGTSPPQAGATPDRRSGDVRGGYPASCHDEGQLYDSCWD